jgi:hypothetical protein
MPDCKESAGGEDFVFQSEGRVNVNLQRVFEVAIA